MLSIITIVRLISKYGYRNYLIGENVVFFNCEFPFMLDILKLFVIVWSFPLQLK